MQNSEIQARNEGSPKIAGSEAVFIGLVITLTLIFAVCCTAIFFLLRHRPSTGRAQHFTHDSVASFDSTAPIQDKYPTRTSATSHPREGSSSTLSRLANAFRATLPSFGTNTTSWRRAATEDDDAWDAREGVEHDAELGMRHAKRPQAVVVSESDRKHPSERAETTYDVVQYPTLHSMDSWQAPPALRRSSISSLSETSTIIAPLSPPLAQRAHEPISYSPRSPIDELGYSVKNLAQSPTSEYRSRFTERL